MFFCSSRNVLVQSANAASPVVIRSGTSTNIASQNVMRQSLTPSANTMHIQCVPVSASGISVVPQPVGGGALPTQPIRMLQASSAHPQAVQQPQQYQVLQQQQPGSRLIQTASGQLVLQQPQVLKPTDPASGNQTHIVVNNTSQIVINSAGSQRVNYGSVQGVQLAGGLQLQSAVGAQPLVLQQQATTPSNRNIIVQTLPVVSAAGSQIQLGGSGARPASALLPNRSGHPTSSNPANDPSGMLIQIGSQTYRVQGVQQLQVVNAVRPTAQQIAPATPSQPSALPRQINVASPSQPLANISQLNAVTPNRLSVAPRHATVATPSQPSQQLTVASSSQASVGSLAGQTITLTTSQLALLKQTPPEKQLALIQQFQAAQRSAPRPAVSSVSNGAVGSPLKTLQVASSALGSSPQRTPLSTQTARLSAPTIVRTGPPIAVRVDQNPSTGGYAHTTGMQVLRPKPPGETNVNAIVGQYH